ncbi:MAG: hypothetical protein U1F83_04320 [Verrucomicrobiota bacterium]
MTPPDTVAVALLGLIGLVVAGCILMAVLVRRLLQQETIRNEELSEDQPKPAEPSFLPPQNRRPACWLAIRSRDMVSVQSALGLRNAAPCSWAEGLVADRKIFIAPPVNGWTLVFGSGLPDPGEDVDVAFRFLRERGRSHRCSSFCRAVVANITPALAEFGRIVRAYAWAGATVWNQGVKTTAETTLGVKCFAYGEVTTTDDWTVADFIVANVEKVPQIARRWSLDPAEIDLRTVANAQGIAGHHSQRY